MKRIYLLTILFCLALSLRAVEAAKAPSVTVSGYVRDAGTGEELIGANVFVKKLSSGSITNQYGYYSLTLAPGMYSLTYSYIGYTAMEKMIDLNADTILNIYLAENAEQLEEVEVSTRRKNHNITSLETGTIELPIQSIRKIPAFMGEVDVIKSIQMLPGVQAASEGTSSFSVRGGSTDQNLILLDEATVYNASHFLGFFSVFNNDAIKDVTLYKGDIPASSGGRLSSLLDVRMKEGSTKKFGGTGGLGLISSRLTLEGPIVKDKTSFLVAGRRFYADLFLPLLKNPDIRDNKLFFYDLNAKINHIINDKNRLFISGYFGRDVFENQFAGMHYGNRTLTARWNHLFSPKIFSNFTIISTYYDYFLGTPKSQPNSFEWRSNLQDYSIKADFTSYANPLTTFKFGFSSTFHQLNPGNTKSNSAESAFISFKIPDNYALEHGIYAMGEEKLGYKWSVKYGLRLSAFQNIGRATLYHFDAAYEKTDSTVYPSGKIFNTYAALEPRLGANYAIDDNNSVKFSYSRTAQYMQLAENSVAGTPLAIWFPASPNVRPQISDQVSAGYFKDFGQHTIQTSVELYYKSMHHTIDFKDHAALLLNPELEGELRTGRGWAYGAEFLIRLDKKDLNGWISYTLSRSKRQIKGINNDAAYNSPYDKPNDIAVVINYRLSNRLEMGVNWIFTSGPPYTFPVGRYEILGKVLPVYSKRNEYRFENYHRLDVSITLKGKDKPGKLWHSEWNFSVYNAYGRKNTWAINFVQDEDNPEKTYAEKTYLFSVIPAITYNFKF